MAGRRRPGRPRKYKRLSERAVEVNPETARGITGVLLGIFAILVFLSYFGLAGGLGKFIHQGFRLVFGWPAYFLPFFFIGFAWMLLKPLPPDQEERVRLSTYLGALLFFLSLPGLVHLFIERSVAAQFASLGLAGGWIGFGVSSLFYKLLDFWASLLLLLGFTLVSLMMVTNQSMSEIGATIKRIFFGTRIEREAVRVGEEQPRRGLFGILRRRRRPQPEPQPAPIKETAIDDTSYPLPTMDLLEDKVSKPNVGNIDGNVKIIQKTLENFNIQVTMGEVNIGPTVSQYTLKPATGVKLNQITARSNDLALALAAHPIRIEAPIPGRSAAGIEVPNKVPALVRLREMLSTEQFNSLRSKLGFMLGRDVAGIPVSADLEKMPHLLIAGATGSGKSICINSIILTLLFRNSPQDLRFLLIDPKRVELVAYNGIPHLLCPVVTDIKKTISALKWAVAEMERRYQVFQESGKRNIEVYNMQAKEKLPYIIVIIDELADLMAAAARDVEGSIVRIAQMARATGIHLIVATQRPSVDVITGLIKANITARIAFAVASGVDSRTILDMQGAEKLLGNGDMLYIASDSSRPTRIQGIFASEKEIKAVTEFLKERSVAPSYDEKITSFRIQATEIGEGTPDDEMFDEAVEVVVRAKKASASLLQRRLRIGYARAARLLDLLEEKGVVGPANGAKPRDVLIDEAGGRFKFEDH